MPMKTVADPSSQVQDMQHGWSLAAALIGGTDAMRLSGESLLPKWPNEEAQSYKSRLSTATLFPAYQRTVHTLSSKPFSKPVTVGEDVPAQLLPWLEDVDLEGRNLDTFAAEVLEGALGYGLCGILVEYPKTGPARTLADERQQGLRPYWVHIKPSQILGWRAARVNGAWRIEQLRLMESVSEPDGDFGEVSIEQVRVLTPGAWQTYRKNEKGEWVLHEDGVTSLTYVPFVPVYGQRTGFMTAKPPLMGLAHMNVQHWQKQSDADTLMHTASVPILAVIGVDDDKWTLTVGAASAVKLPTGATMMFVEHSGAAIAAGRVSLQDLEERMRQSGAELLVLDTKMTATQVSSENSIGMCTLQRIASGLNDALNLALQYTADWVSAGDGGHVVLFNDYAASTLSEASEQLLLSAQQAGLISKVTTINELKRRGTLSAQVDAEEESQTIDGEGPSLGMMGDDHAPAGTTPQLPSEPLTAEPALDIAPLTDAIMALVGRMDAQLTQPATLEAVAAAPVDFTALIAAIKDRPESVVTMEATIDATPIAKAVAEAIAAIPRQEPPIINMPPITVEQPSITINNPQAAPISIAQPAINIAAPSGNKSATMTKLADGSYVMQVVTNSSE